MTRGGPFGVQEEPTDGFAGKQVQVHALYRHLIENIIVSEAICGEQCKHLTGDTQKSIELKNETFRILFAAINFVANACWHKCERTTSKQQVVPPNVSS